MSGSFEYALDYLIDQQLDLSRLDRRYQNDANGAYATPIKHPHGKWRYSINSKPSPLPYTERMKQAIDSPEGRKRYGQRMATVEPVFGIRSFTGFSA